MIQFISQPADICFAAETITYKVYDNASTGYKVLSLKIEYVKDGITKNKTIPIKCHAYQTDGSSGAYYEAELSDIIKAYTYRYTGEEGEGYARFRIIQIDSTDTSSDDDWHVCLPCSSGGLVLSGMIPSNIHPFLIARGNEEGAIHFYRSELIAMDMLYVFVTDEYYDHSEETDNNRLEGREYKTRRICGYNLFGVWLSSDVNSQYSIADEANALFLTFLYYDSSQEYEEDDPPEEQIYIIAIQDDPDTDETHLIRWTNSMGVPEALLLTGEMKDISAVDNPDMYISKQTTQTTQRALLRKTTTTKYSLQSGYLTPARRLALVDMLASDEVEMQINGQWAPVSITADTKHSVQQREPESFELTIEVLEQTRYHKPNRTVRPLPSTRAGLLQDNSGNFILDNNSNTIEENG